MRNMDIYTTHFVFRRWRWAPTVSFLGVRDLVVLEVVGHSAGVAGGDVDVVLDLDLLQVLSGQVLDVSLGEGGLGGDLNAAGAVGSGVLGDADLLAEVTLFAVDLDVGLEEIKKLSELDDSVLSDGRAVDVEVQDGLLLLSLLALLQDGCSAGH